MKPTAAILPIKQFHSAKSRLQPLGYGELLPELVKAMLSDTLAAVADCPTIDLLLLITNEQDLPLNRPEFDGRVEIVSDSGCFNHSEAVERGIKILNDRDYGTTLFLAGDCPLMIGSELTEIIEGFVGATNQIAVMPDRHGGGTNGAIASSPGLFTPSFGAGSCERHAQAAIAQGSRLSIVEIDSFRHDIDNPHDLIEITLRDDFEARCPSLSNVLAQTSMAREIRDQLLV